MRIAWIGAGMMGRAMASRLLVAGHEIAVYNRTWDRALPLLEQGATESRTPRAAAQGADLVVTCLTDGAALAAVLAGEDGVLAGTPSGGLVVDMSTVGMAAAQQKPGGTGHGALVCNSDSLDLLAKLLRDPQGQLLYFHFLHVRCSHHWLAAFSFTNSYVDTVAVFYRTVLRFVLPNQ